MSLANDHRSLLVLESSAIRAVVDPQHGGAIQSLRTPESPTDWIFFDHARRPTPLARGEAYDDVWAGGFEELFPSDAPGIFDGRHPPDHGELWNAAPEVVEQTKQSVMLQYDCASVPARFEKRISLDARKAGVRMDYRITNTSQEPLRFLFKLHQAMAVAPGDRLLLPGGRVDPVDPPFGSDFSTGPSPWPLVTNRTGGILDLSQVPGPESGRREFVYVSELPEGWCGLERHATGERAIFRFPLTVFPYCWLFLSYGGWRNYYTAVLEPCTNMPKDLNQAAAAGRCARLDPQAALECSVSMTVEHPDG